MDRFRYIYIYKYTIILIVDKWTLPNQKIQIINNNLNLQFKIIKM